jgi:flagellar biosynthesis protein FlhF
MQLRTFLAKDMREALANVRSEMGDEAVIIASEKAKGGGVMVRAALDRPQSEEPSAPEPAPEVQPSEIVALMSFEDKHRADLMRRLRGEPAGAPTASAPFGRAELLTILRGHRLPDALAHDFAKTAEQSGLKDMTLALACALDRRMKIAPLDISKPGAFLLLGPNGAGKTAVAAKIAAHARLKHRFVKLIATDAEGAGAVARLEAFADHLKMRLAIAENAEALAKAVGDAAKENALAVIDSAGFDPRNAKTRTAFQALAMIEGVEALGVVSACGDAEETTEIAAALSLLGAQRLIVTGVDLTRRLGALVSAAAQGLSLAHVTRSPFVAGGLETLTPLSLARALIDASRSADQGSAQ